MIAVPGQIGSAGCDRDYTAQLRSILLTMTAGMKNWPTGPLP
jgi:hypothetical protein